MSTTDFAYFDGSIILDDGESAQGLEDANIPDWLPSAEFIVAACVRGAVACNKATNADSLRIEYSEDGGAWTLVAGGNAMVPGSGTSLENGVNISAMRTTSAYAASVCSGGPVLLGY